MSFLNDSSRDCRHVRLRFHGVPHDVSSPLSGLRILVLEDEALIALDVEQLCRDHGAGEVAIAGNLREAREISAPFDAAIIDVMIGGEPTFDFARSLEAAGVPFVFASGYDKLDEIFVDFPDVTLVSKPYAGADLIEAVTESIRKRARSADS
jgi:DNA-binding response OmpR family regulator